MSAFSDFVSLLKLEVEIYHNAKVCGDWVILEHTLGKTCFHLVTTGSCMLNVPGYLQTEFNAGDLIIFPRELEHKMWPIEAQQGEQAHLAYSTERQGTGMLCGEVSMMHLYQNQLLSALPPVLLIRNDEKAPWLGQLKELLLNESLVYQQSQSETLNRLSELVFIYALRHHIEQQQTQVGLLALYGDPRLARAIKAFHQSPEKKWGLADLAIEAGMSRTSFSKYFKLKSEWTVNQYTNWWRMQKAWEKLKLGDKVSNVAEQVGYQSEAAFSRAFNKQFGKNPGWVRREG